MTPDDIFVGSPPLAFTFGLGGLAVFPLRFGATATLLENASPPEMIKIIETYKATICFTSPTAYRAMMAAMDKGADLSSLRIAVSAGETLPAPVFDAWTRKTGKTILDGIGSTELLHIFITNRTGDAAAGKTGKPVLGYEAKIVDDEMKDVPDGTVGKLAVRGPTGCRYLADSRQTNYVRDGWNLTGDSFVRDEQGRFAFVARSDDMIVSSGYNIAGPEVEAALLSHPSVAECGVVAAPDEARGMIVKAYVIVAAGVIGGCGAGHSLAGSRQARDRALQISARDRICRTIAQDRDRQVAAVCLAADCEAARRPRAWPRNKNDGEYLVSTTKAPGLAVVAEDEVSEGVQVLQPSGWPMPKGYANGMAAEGKLVVTGGVIGWDIAGHLPSDFIAQVRQTLSNIADILAEGGARPEHLVRLTWYVVDIEEYLANLKALGKIYREIFGAHYPAMALVQVVRLVEKAAKVEIEATAVVPR